MRPAPAPHPALDRTAVRAEMDQARADFHRLVSDATPAQLGGRRTGPGGPISNRCSTCCEDDYLGDVPQDLGLLLALADPVRLRLMSLVASHPGARPASATSTRHSTCPSPRSATT